jgi:hypothetical protein
MHAALELNYLYYLEGRRTGGDRMNPRLLLSKPPTDFGGLFSCLCLTDSTSAAERYAAWATRRANHHVPGSTEPLILVLVINSAPGSRA